MAAIPHKTKSGVRHEMSGAGFHTPTKYTKKDRLSKKELEEMADLENREYSALDLFYKEMGRVFGPGLHVDGTPLEYFDLADVVAIFEAGYEQAVIDHG